MAVLPAPPRPARRDARPLAPGDLQALTVRVRRLVDPRPRNRLAQPGARRPPCRAAPHHADRQWPRAPAAFLRIVPARRPDRPDRVAALSPTPRGGFGSSC